MTTAKPKAQSKAGLVKQMLAHAKGATLDEICHATTWQSHSVRAFLTGLRKKGFALTKEQRGNEGTAYRITITPPPPASIKPENAS